MAEHRSSSSTASGGAHDHDRTAGRHRCRPRPAEALLVHAVLQARGRGHRRHGPPRRPARPLPGAGRRRRTAHRGRAGRAQPASTSAGCGSGCTTRRRPSSSTPTTTGPLRAVARGASRCSPTPSHPAFGMGMFGRLPELVALLKELPDSFRSASATTTTPTAPRAPPASSARFAPWYRNFLVPVALPSLDGVVAKLERGRGRRSPTSAAVPGSRCCSWPGRSRTAQVHGYDISRHALRAPRSGGPRRALANAHFHDARREPLPADDSLDLVTTFDCIHDMTHPAGGHGRHPRAPSPPTAPGCSSTSRPARPSPRTWPRTRWRR